MNNFRKFRWDDIDDMIKKIIVLLKNDNWEPDLIVGVIRGGAIPAMWMSNITNIQTDTIKASFRDNVVKHPHLPVTFLKKIANPDFKTLIIDDINDTGETFIWIQNQIRAYHKDADKNLRYASLIHNTPSDFTDLDYYARTINKDRDPAWIVFPWEQ